MDTFLQKFRAALKAGDPKTVELARKANEEIMSYKLLTPGTVHNNATMSNFSVQYVNEAYIGEILMPTLVVGKLSDIFYKMGQNDRRAVPGGEVGAGSSVVEVNESRSTDTYSCQPRSWRAWVDDLTLQNQDAPLDEMLDMLASANEAALFDAEVRRATVLTTSSNYASANTSALAAADRWDTASGGDPVKNIQDAVSAIESGAGNTELVGWCSHDVANVLQRHPALLDMFKSTAKGLVPLDAIASWFGLSRIVKGSARKNTANEGQTAVKARIWGSDYFGITRVARTPGKRVACFGMTFQFGQKNTTTWYDQGEGYSGRYWGKVGQCHDYKVVANDCGYLYRTVIG